jgi:hypothetical protein
MRTVRRILAIGALALAGGCVEADLGDAPLYCNTLEPRCPRGYTCVAREGDGEEICLRPGQSSSVTVDGGPLTDGL